MSDERSRRAFGYGPLLAIGLVATGAVLGVSFIGEGIVGISCLQSRSQVQLEYCQGALALPAGLITFGPAAVTAVAAGLGLRRGRLGVVALVTAAMLVGGFLLQFLWAWL